MQPKTSVRPPVIAGARRQHLSELLRQWRRQPRKRSPLLFWGLLSLALMSDGGLFFLTARLAPGLPGGHPPASRGVNELINGTSRLLDLTPARLALYSSLLAAVFLAAAAAAVKLRWPLWRRRFLHAGLLSALCCLGMSAPLLGHATSASRWLLSDGGLGMFWSSSVLLGLGLLLAMFFRDVFVAFAGVLTSSAGFLAANFRPMALAQTWPALPHGAAYDTCLRVQVLMLLSAYAALALAWSIAALSLVQILLEPSGNERLRRLAVCCLWPIRLGVLLLAASALLDGWQTLGQGFAWHRWNAQALATLLVLPGCAALVYAQRRVGISPFCLLLSVTLGFPCLVVVWQLIVLWSNGGLHLAAFLSADVTSFAIGLLSLSLATHAALRYYFSKQRLLEVY